MFVIITPILFLFTNSHAYVRSRVDKENTACTLMANANLQWQNEDTGYLQFPARDLPTLTLAPGTTTHGLLHSGEKKPMENPQTTNTKCLPEYGGSERETHRKDLEIICTGEIRLPPKKTTKQYLKLGIFTASQQLTNMNTLRAFNILPTMAGQLLKRWVRRWVNRQHDNCRA